MCGIVGTIGLADRGIISAMNDVIVHRGPDDQGVFVDEHGRVAFGHRRLSIIDLSSAGCQPMSYMEGRYWIVYNGEIYNFKEIRAELIQKGYAFVSNTDTEVLLGSYAEWGQDCLRKLRGMFAFAIYDRRSGDVFLARDRFGIKPLYYSRQGGVLIFASEIKALLASNLVLHSADPQAIWDYLSLGSIAQPRTILKDVHALLPGHAMIVSAKGEVDLRRYWNIWDDSLSARGALHSIGAREAAEELRQKLEEATRLHMIADVPVGAFLSGGIDSTAIVGLMSKVVSHPLKTYSVGFESRHSNLNELHWARIASECFGTDHTEVIITETDVANHYEDLVDAIDQPSEDGTNTYFVSKAARQGVTVALSGLGGDELFAGYDHFSSLARASSREQRFPAWFRNIYSSAAEFFPHHLLPVKGMLSSTPLLRYSMFRSRADEATKRRITSQSLQSIFRPIPLAELYRPWVKLTEDSVALTSYVEINGYLANTLLRDGDAMSMAHSLEVRPVLLDHVTAEYAFALPSHLKLKDGRGKGILLDALRDLIPMPILNRPKMGFQMPLFGWLVGPLKDRALGALSSPNAQRIFSKEYVSKAMTIIREPRQNDRKLWGYVMLIEWMNANRCSL